MDECGNFCRLKRVVLEWTNALSRFSSRIENIGLYAGLTEKCRACERRYRRCLGKRFLHLMQTRLYMDEECLVNYRHGGMQITDIGMFDDWLSEDEKYDQAAAFFNVAWYLFGSDGTKKKTGKTMI